MWPYSCVSAHAQPRDGCYASRFFPLFPTIAISDPTHRRKVQLESTTRLEIIGKHSREDVTRRPVVSLPSSIPFLRFATLSSFHARPHISFLFSFSFCLSTRSSYNASHRWLHSAQITRTARWDRRRTLGTGRSRQTRRRFQCQVSMIMKTLTLYAQAFYHRA